MSCTITTYAFWVMVDGEREYFRLLDLEKANKAAQSEANRTGQPVSRHDIGRGFRCSMFYPEVSA